MGAHASRVRCAGISARDWHDAKPGKDAGEPQARCLRSQSWPEALVILDRTNKRPHHLRIDEVAVELVELVQPEIKAVKIQVGLWRRIRISSQIPQVLHQHK